MLRQPIPQDLKGGISAGSLMTALFSLFVHKGFGIEEVSIYEAGEEQSDQGLSLLCRTCLLSEFFKKSLSGLSIL